jgi:O-succinylbenzoic acid--CoA ligase
MAIIVPKINPELFEYLDDSLLLKKSLENFISEWNNSTSIIISKTSGSTGKAKEILLCKEKMLISAQKTANYFNFEENETIGLALSPNTVGGKMQIIRSIVKSQKLVILPNNRNPLKYLDKKIDFLTLVPLQLETILAENPKKLNLVKTVLLGGAAISVQLKDKLKESTSNFYEGYGMTETYSHIALRNINSDAHFQSLSGVKISKTAIGSLILDIPYLGLKNLITNDLVEIKNAYQFKILGRTDFVINSGGLKYSPEVLEEKIAKYIPSTFFIFGRPDSQYGQKICILIEGEKDEVVDLQAVFVENLSRYENPKEIFYLPQFDRTESGKINRLKTISQLS